MTKSALVLLSLTFMVIVQTTVSLRVAMDGRGVSSSQLTTATTATIQTTPATVKHIEISVLETDVAIDRNDSQTEKVEPNHPRNNLVRKRPASQVDDESEGKNEGNNSEAEIRENNQAKKGRRQMRRKEAKERRRAAEKREKVETRRQAERLGSHENQTHGHHGNHKDHGSHGDHENYGDHKDHGDHARGDHGNHEAHGHHDSHENHEDHEDHGNHEDHKNHSHNVSHVNHGNHNHHKSDGENEHQESLNSHEEQNPKKREQDQLADEATKNDQPLITDDELDAQTLNKTVKEFYKRNEHTVDVDAFYNMIFDHYSCSRRCWREKELSSKKVMIDQAESFCEVMVALQHELLDCSETLPECSKINAQEVFGTIRDSCQNEWH